MRAGLANCSSQHNSTLSQEAALVLNNSLILAKRRGHAQLTPLHVAATLLISSSSPSKATFFKRACIRSKPHIDTNSLQHYSRALELCFNVALNRLPVSTFSHERPLMHGKQEAVFLSNALVAALKRAQACVKRGCVEQQNSTVVGSVRVELEQLVLSILDDPSVSRVMREAGCSSISVKNILENSFMPVPEQNPFVFPTQKMSAVTNNLSLKGDVEMVLRALVDKRRVNQNVVVVGDSLFVSEGFVSELMRRLETGGEHAVDELRSNVFINFQVSSLPLRLMKREEVEMNVSDLKRKVDYIVSSGGKALIYTGDLKWIVDEDSNDLVEYLVDEIGKMVSWYNNVRSSGSVRLLSVASYKIYSKCRMRQIPLDVQWSLQAVSVPCGSNGLRLSLNNGTSDLDTRNLHPNHCHRTVARFRRQRKSCHDMDFDFGNGSSKVQSDKPNFDALEAIESDKELKISLSIDSSYHNNNSSTNERIGKFFKLFEENGPRQSKNVIQMRLLVHQEYTFDSGILTSIGHKRKSDSCNMDLIRKSKIQTKQRLHAFDLNIKAVGGDEEHKSNSTELSPVSSDVTLEETSSKHRNSTTSFLAKINNSYVSKRNSDNLESGAKQTILSKFQSSLQDEAGGVLGNICSFDIEEMLLERVFEKSGGLYLGNCLFGQWLRDVFRKCLNKVFKSSVEREKIVSVRLCLGQSGSEQDGFMGTCLPIEIPVVSCFD